MVLLEYIALPLLIALLMQIIRWRAYRLFPWFCGYVSYQIVIGAARFIVHNHPNTYFVTYWLTETGYEILTVAALYEVYRVVFRGLTQTWWFRLIFPLVALTTIALIFLHILFAPIPSSNRLFVVIITSELCTELFPGLMFFVLVACVAIFGLRWRQYAFGITAGLGLYGTVNLVATTKISVFVTSSTIMWDWICIAAYSGSVLIWLWYFRKPQEPEPSGVSEEFIQKARSELELYRKLIRRARDL